jgi:hypothetical protein
MEVRGLSKFARVAIKLLQAILAAVPILLSVVFYQAYWQDHGGSPASLGDRVFSIVFLTAGSYVVCGMFAGVLFGLWGIVRAVIAILGGETASSGHTEAIMKDDSSFDEEEWKSRYYQDRNQ